eukprot:9253252-Pyramimonas_sp.AAC.1
MKTTLKPTPNLRRRFSPLARQLYGLQPLKETQHFVLCAAHAVGGLPLGVSKVLERFVASLERLLQ